MVDATVAFPDARVVVGRSTRAVPRFDENVVTLAAEAALDVVDRHSAAALIVATTTAPLAEGGMVHTLAEMLGITGLTMELGGSVGAGAEGMAAGMALVSSGVEPVLVIAADTRRDPDGRPLGAGAAATLLGADGDGGELELTDAATSWFPDVWRRPGSDRVEIGDRSFAPIAPASRQAKAGHVVFGPTGSEIERAGNLGSAGLAAGMILGAPRKGSSKTFVSAAGGSVRAFRLTGGPGTANLRRRARAARDGGIETTMPLSVDLEEFHPYVSEPRSWRERGQDLRLEAVRDANTGEVFYPPIPAASGRTVETLRLRRTGRVVTFTRDHVYPVGGPMSMVVVDLDGGGRFVGQSAWDFPMEIDMRVRLVPRLLHRGGGLDHYFWKVVG